MSRVPASAEILSDQIRRIVLEQSKRAHVGHIGSALSIADIVAALYDGVLQDRRSDDPERDRFILSKGHAALALYAALHLRGWLARGRPRHLLRRRQPARRPPGARPARASTSRPARSGRGSRSGAGAALAARLQRSPRRVFVLLSDAECNEGSVWEAVMFAAHHRLAQPGGDRRPERPAGARLHRSDVLDLSPLAERWRAFGWDVHEVDGHDREALARRSRGLGHRRRAGRTS